jgi:hypothetical protein
VDFGTAEQHNAKGLGLFFQRSTQQSSISQRTCEKYDNFANFFYFVVKKGASLKANSTLNTTRTDGDETHLSKFDNSQMVTFETEQVSYLGTYAESCLRDNFALCIFSLFFSSNFFSEERTDLPLIPCFNMINFG